MDRSLPQAGQTDQLKFSKRLRLPVGQHRGTFLSQPAQQSPVPQACRIIGDVIEAAHLLGALVDGALVKDRLLEDKLPPSSLRTRAQGS